MNSHRHRTPSAFGVVPLVAAILLLGCGSEPQPPPATKRAEAAAPATQPTRDVFEPVAQEHEEELSEEAIHAVAAHFDPSLSGWSTGRFRDVADEAGVEGSSAGVDVAWADVDGDGLLDLHVSNTFSSAGNRIAYQRRFRQGGDEETVHAMQRPSRGKALLRNLGDGTSRT